MQVRENRTGANIAGASDRRVVSQFENPKNKTAPCPPYGINGLVPIWLAQGVEVRMVYKAKARNEVGAIGATKKTLIEAIVQAKGWADIGLKGAVVEDETGAIVWSADDAPRT